MCVRVCLWAHSGSVWRECTCTVLWACVNLWKNYKKKISLRNTVIPPVYKTEDEENLRGCFAVRNATNFVTEYYLSSTDNSAGILNTNISAQTITHSSYCVLSGQLFCFWEARFKILFGAPPYFKHSWIPYQVSVIFHIHINKTLNNTTFLRLQNILKHFDNIS